MSTLYPPGQTGTRVLALLGKGGSAKTTSTASLGDAIARRGYRVLLMDLDVQTSLSDWLAPRSRSLGVYDCVLEGAETARAVVELRPGLHLLPGTPDRTLLLERHIEARPRRREEVISTWISQAAQDYDIVVMDTPRGLAGPLSLNALEAADAVVLPVEPAGMGLDALREQVVLVEAIAEERRRPGLLAGVLPTRVTRTNIAAVSLDAMAAAGLRVLPGIPASTVAAEAVTARMLLADYAEDSPATGAYDEVAAALTGIELPEDQRPGAKKKSKKKRKKAKGKK